MTVFATEAPSCRYVWVLGDCSGLPVCLTGLCVAPVSLGCDLYCTGNSEVICYDFFWRDVADCSPRRRILHTVLKLLACLVKFFISPVLAGLQADTNRLTGLSVLGLCYWLMHVVLRSQSDAGAQRCAERRV